MAASMRRRTLKIRRRRAIMSNWREPVAAATFVQILHEIRRIVSLAQSRYVRAKF